MRVFLLSMFLMIPLIANAQRWQDMGGFPTDTTFTDAIHGVAVDGEGKVWIQPWSARAWIDPATGDSVRDGSGNAISTVTIFVYNPDGTEALDPIHAIDVGGVVDTLYGNLRGLRTDHNGDILVAGGTGNLWRIDHMTGEGMDKVVVGSGPLSAPGVSDNGNIFGGFVIPGNPVKEYGSDFGFLSNAVDSAFGFSRSFEVSGDGNTIYWSGYSNIEIHRYTRPDEFSAFNQVPDTLLRGIVSESILRNPQSGNIWFSNAPAAGATPDTLSEFGDPSQYLTWYEWDPETEAIVDSMKYVLAAPVGDEKARGIAFNPSGDVAYLAIWDTNGNTSVRKVIDTTPDAIEVVDGDIPTNFTLSQNYPNPFNPSTKISFDLKELGHAKLVVYDMLGREVARLVDETLPANSYTVTFDANKLSSGIYIYGLEFKGQKLTGTMTLLK